MTTKLMTRTTIKKGSAKKVLLNGAMAVYVATSGFSIISQYVPNPGIVRATSPDKEKSQINSAVIQKRAMAYNTSKPYVKPFMLRTDSKSNEEEIGMVDNTEFHNTTSEPVFIPVRYGGKLSIKQEDEFTLNHEREVVQFRNMKKVSLPVHYGGKLPVGRERA